jgi:hypothetical protein
VASISFVPTQSIPKTRCESSPAQKAKLDQNKRRKNQTLSEDEKRVPRGNKLSMPAPATTVFLSLFDVNFNNKPL